MAEAAERRYDPTVTLVSGRSLTEPGVLFLGGWDANPVLMHGVQLALAKRLDAPSIALSAFDSINPVEKRDLLDVEDYQPGDYSEEDQAWIASLPPRMIDRALTLNRLADSMLGEMLETPRVVTHCAGGNVLLLANLLRLKKGQLPVLPTRGVLSEPMLREGQRVMKLALQFQKFEANATLDSRLISLAGLRSEYSEDLAMQASAPIGDILNSTGIHLYETAAQTGMDYPIVLGQEDIAAPDTVTRDQLEKRDLGYLASNYPDQSRVGHGYLLALPHEATAHITGLLLRDA
jgi:hypothetical protein